MKKLLTIMVSVLLACLLLAVGASAADDKDISVLVIGNSITEHGPSESLGWFNNWGMAASEESKDYFHVLESMTKEAYPDCNISFSKAGAYTFEKSVSISTDYDYSKVIDACFGKEMRAANPDIITFQWGDNSKNCNEESFAYALGQVVDYCRAYNPDVTLIFSMHYYGSAGDDKCLAVADVAKEKGVTFVRLYPCNTPDNSAKGQYENSGVAGHPGDKGMQAIAETFFTEVKKAIDTKLGKGEITVMVDGKFVEFDVPPTIIDGRTLVPVRAIFEALGASVEWDQATKTASSQLGTDKISLTLNSSVMIKNDEEIALDVPATIIDGRTLVPARAIAEAYGCQVNWLKTTREVQVWPAEMELDISAKVEGALVYGADAQSQTVPKGITATSVDEMLFVKNPEDESDYVYYIKSNIAAGTPSWSYIWADTTGEMKAGQRYLVSFDIMHVDTVAGVVPAATSTGICFKFADTADGGNVKDHGVARVEIVPGTWKHVDFIYTVPATMDETQASKFGVFANPDNGVDAINFYIDDLSVVPFEGNVGDGFVADASIIEAMKDFKFDESKGIMVNFEDLTFGGCEAELTGGEVVMTATGGDPQANLKDLSLDASQYGMIAVKFKYSGVADNATFQIYFTTDTETSLSESKSDKCSYAELEDVGNGYYVGYFQMSANDFWKGTVTQLRFDPANSTGTYTISQALIVKTN